MMPQTVPKRPTNGAQLAVVAIPALIAYNHFVQQIKVLAVEMDNFCQEFLNIAERHFFK